MVAVAAPQPAVPTADSTAKPGRPQRRPLFQKLIGSGVLPAGYATDDGVGIVYHGTEFVEAVTEVRGKGAYRVTREGGQGEEGGPGRDGGQAREERIEPRVLPGAS